MLLATLLSDTVPEVWTRQFSMRSIRKPFKCRYCHRAFTTGAGLGQHGRDSHPDEVQNFAKEVKSGQDGPSSQPDKAQNMLAPSWPCVVCKTKFSTKVNLRSHQRATNHCFCRQHRQYFASKASATAHYNGFEHVSHFHCCDCSRDFISEQALNQHLEDGVHRQLKCQICQQILGGLPALEFHVVKVHQASAKSKRKFYSEQANTCYICQRKFYSEQANTCYICQRKFKNNNS